MSVSEGGVSRNNECTCKKSVENIQQFNGKTGVLQFILKAFSLG